MVINHQHSLARREYIKGHNGALAHFLDVKYNMRSVVLACEHACAGACPDRRRVAWHPSRTSAVMTGAKRRRGEERCAPIEKRKRKRERVREKERDKRWCWPWGRRHKRIASHATERNPPLKFTLLRRSLTCARLPYETLLSTRERWCSGESEIDFQFKPLIKRIEISVTVLSLFPSKSNANRLGQFSEKHLPTEWKENTSLLTLVHPAMSRAHLEIRHWRDKRQFQHRNPRRHSTSGWQSLVREPLSALLMSSAQGGWMSPGIFLGWATGESTRARARGGCPELSRIDCRWGAARHEQGKPEIECAGVALQERGGAVVGRRVECRERERERGGGGQKPSARICYGPRMLRPQAVRERETAGPKPGTDCPPRREEVGNEVRHLPRHIRGNECFRN